MIDPFDSWSKRGNYLTHMMIDREISSHIIYECATSYEQVAEIFEYIIGKFFGTEAKYLLKVIGAPFANDFSEFLGLIITDVLSYLTLDEDGNIWVWMSNAYLDWLEYNAEFFNTLPLLNASFCTLHAFSTNGYLQIGQVGLWDAIGNGFVPYTVVNVIDGSPPPEGGGGGLPDGRTL